MGKSTQSLNDVAINPNRNANVYPELSFPVNIVVNIEHTTAAPKGSRLQSFGIY